MSHYESRAPYIAQHPSALAVYCSDGRFTQSVEELLLSLGEERLDTLTLPGGPALLDHTSSSFSSLEVVRDSASFLIRGHSIRRVVLIAHAECGYYRARFQYESAQAMQRRQLNDLAAAARWIEASHRGVAALTFYATARERPNGTRGVVFEQVGIAPR
ncbi:MAG TPA: carbonic anhydrase [Polyangiaceae bacterium]|nr:carbonic anhydrase [Polyangiaceae bacterium]